MTGNCPAGATLHVFQPDLQLRYNGPPSVPSIPFFVPANMPPPSAPFTITPGRSFAIGADLVGSGQVIRSNTVTITQDTFRLPEENVCVQDSELSVGDVHFGPEGSLWLSGAVRAGPYCRWNVDGILTLDPDKDWAYFKADVNIGPGGFMISVRKLTPHRRLGFFTLAGRRRKVIHSSNEPSKGCTSGPRKIKGVN
jgi:hypothetical protein